MSVKGSVKTWNPGLLSSLLLPILNLGWAAEIVLEGFWRVCTRLEVRFH